MRQLSQSAMCRSAAWRRSGGRILSASSMISVSVRQRVRAIYHRTRVIIDGVDGELRTAELSLAAACARGDPSAIAELERSYIAGLDRVVAHLGDAAFADEVKQQVRARLLTR